MTPQSLLTEIDEILSTANIIPDTRKYWLVRTQGGSFYETFRDNSFIAVNYDEIKNFEIDAIKKSSKNTIEVIRGIKALAKKAYKDEARPGLIASQIFKFIYEIKKGDVVVIPSYNSDDVNFGYIKQTPLLQVNRMDIAETNCPYLRRKGVRWVKEQPRYLLDPYLYRVLQAHQAINDISVYGEVIERTLGNFYVKDGTANVILDVNTNEKIQAKDLFSLGYFLLNYTQGFFERNQLPLNIGEVQVKLNVNSKGKIQLKSANYRVIWLIAVFVVAINGGGLDINIPGIGRLNLSTDGIIKNVIEYQNSAQDREMKENLMTTMDSLRIKSPDDAVKMLKQFSQNKDLPQ